MAPIDDALAEVYSYEPGEKISFEGIAKKHGVVRSTLRRRHLGLHQSRETKAINQRMIIPQQEEELVKYIEGLIERRLPPKRGLIKSFASVIAKRPVSDSWVSRFIKRNKDRVTPQWMMGVDTERYSSPEKLKREKEAKEKRAKEKEAKEKAAKEKEAREKAAKEKAAKEKAAKEKKAIEKEAKKKRAREKEFREKRAKEKMAKEKEAKEKKAKEKKEKEKKAKEKEVKAKKAKAKKAKEKEAKEKEAKKKEAKKVKATRAEQAVGRARQQEAQKQSHDTENALKLPRNGKRKASQSSTLESKRQKRVDTSSNANAVEKLSAAPALTTRRGRNVRLPSRYQ